MSLLAVVVTVLIVLAAVLIGIVLSVFFAFRWLWLRTRSDQRVLRGAILATGLLLLASPLVAFAVADHSFALSRVPEPLVVDAIEYRLEESWGHPLLPLPGDNETGFVVYRLTDESAAWARRQGDELGNVLSGTGWRSTPVDDRNHDRAVSQWHHYDHDPQMMSRSRPPEHPPTIQEFLEKYGFTIPIQNGRDTEADQAIQNAGSFYRLGKAGSVTIVDPQRGKVYFAYAG